MSKKQILLLVVLCCFLVSTLMHINAQVTIGSLQEPNRGAILDLKEEGTTTRGLGMPRVILKDLNKLTIGDNVIEDEGMAWEKHTGLLVYNMNKCIDRSGEGLYVWKGNKWESLSGRDQYERDALYQPNSYWVTPGTTKVQIPVEKAFRIWEYFGSAEGKNRLPSESVAGALTPVLYWQDAVIVPSSGSLSVSSNDRKGIITVNLAGGSVKGNAVIGLQDGRGTIRWSWHIWVTDDPTKAGLNGGGHTWMDRNLGATTTDPSDVAIKGLLYQWGRKDPFPASQGWSNDDLILQSTHGEVAAAIDKSKTNDNTTQINFKNSIAYPLSFIKKASTTSGDWYNSSEQSDGRWNERWGMSVDGCFNKSPFDPCPKGWKVPTHEYNEDMIAIKDENPWKELINGAVEISVGNNARQWENFGVYPFAGNRSYSTGNLAGNVGYVWSASVSSGANTDMKSYTFYINRTTAKQISTLDKAWGLSVRCVEE